MSSSMDISDCMRLGLREAGSGVVCQCQMACAWEWWKVARRDCSRVKLGHKCSGPSIILGGITAAEYCAPVLPLGGLWEATSSSPLLFCTSGSGFMAHA